MAADPALTAAIGELADAVLYGAAGVAVAILLMGSLIAAILDGRLSPAPSDQRPGRQDPRRGRRHQRRGGRCQPLAL